MVNNKVLLLAIIGLPVLALLLRRLQRRIELSRAKHRSLAGHARLSRWLGALVPFYEFDEQQFFHADGAPQEVGQQRRAGFLRLAALYVERFAKTARLSNEVQGEIADL